MPSNGAQTGEDGKIMLKSVNTSIAIADILKVLTFHYPNRA
ncbi:MAG: hypothetical protein QNJ46_06480 [Leptolyngbyaceae cyanobacterium MO_188.B28]|nr:hypothetical protein [Leptolyngbyaceae cyanobacterium MO_188.B28]